MKSFTFDEYGNLDPVSQLVGKTITSVHGEPGWNNGPPGTWDIHFTDGTAITLQAHYDDSEVFFVEYKPNGVEQ